MLFDPTKSGGHKPNLFDPTKSGGHKPNLFDPTKSGGHKPTRWRRTIVLVPLLFGLVMACPKKPPTVDSDAATSTSATKSAESAESSATWKTVTIADPPDVSFDGDPDADLDGGETADAEQPDVRLKMDAQEDAPLMGAVTFLEETPTRGIRRITSTAAKIHKAPKDGTTIATLPKGTEVHLVAEFSEWLRIKYVDPVTAVRRQGWIFIANIAGPRRKDCPEGWNWHPQDGGFCDRECKRNADCKAIKGYKCSGTGCFYAAD